MKRMISRRSFMRGAGILAVAAGMTACGTQTAASPQQAASSGAASSAAASAGTASAGTTVISISNSYTEMDQVNTELDTAAKNIKDRTNGAIEVKVFPNNTFGNMADGVEAIASNSPLMLMAAYSQFDDQYPDGSALQCAFVFDTGEEVLKLMDTDLFAEIVDAMDQVNIHALPCSFIGGMRQVIGKDAYTTPEKIKGLKIRVPASTPYLDCFNALGASPMGMAASEQLQALSSGTVNALDQSISLMYSTKSYELVNQVTLLAQMPLADSLFCSTTWWNTLSEDQRDIINDELKQAGQRYYEYASENESKMRKEMEAAGVVFNEVDRAPFADMCKDLIQQYSIGQKVLDAVAQVRKDIAAGK